MANNIDMAQAIKAINPSAEFRYEDDNGDFVDCLENKGWNFRFFYTRDTSSPFWHSIYTETERVSLGTFLGRDQDKIKNLLGDTV